MTVALARITLMRAKTVVFLFVSCARFPCVRTHTNFCMAWLNPPIEEGLSPKRLVYLKKIITFHSILALYTVFLQYHTRMSFLLNPSEFGQKDTQKQVFQLKI